jgi:predicted metal-dependent hydrolase
MHRDRRLILKSPYWVSDHVAKKFLRQNIDWISKKYDEYSKYTSLIPKYTKNDYQKNKEKLLKKIIERVEAYNKIYCLKYESCVVKDMSSRWGSCSKRGVLCFSYKMLYLPDGLFDYVIVHELCHLGEFNHSLKFWNLVSIAMPNWKVLRKDLKLII